MSRELLNIVKSQILEKLETLKEAKNEILCQKNIYIYNQKRERFDSLYIEFENLIEDRLHEFKKDEEAEEDTASSMSEGNDNGFFKSSLFF